MKAVSRAIQRLPALMRQLPNFEQALLQQHSRTYTALKGEHIVREGDIVDRVVYIAKGWCAFELDGSPVEVLAPGSVTFCGAPYSNSAAAFDLVALSKVSLIEFERSIVFDVGARHPEALRALVESSLACLVRAHASRSLKGAEPLELRLLDLLWHLSSSVGPDLREVPRQLTQSVLGSLLGTTREEVSRKRQMLIKAGFLVQKDDTWGLTPATLLALSGLTGTLIAYPE